MVWGIIAFLVFFVAFRPGAAGDVVATLGNIAADIFSGVGDFFGILIG